MGLSYLRSAYEDMALIQPSRKQEFKNIIKIIKDSKSFIGKSYNISLKIK